MSKILVTGGMGYIGSHTVVELLNAGYEVIIIDNLSNSSSEVLNRIEKITGKRPAFFETEMCNYDELENIFATNPGIDAVIHFAAFLQVNESVQQPLMYFENNLYSQINLLKCMRKYEIKPIVFSSSCTVYGNPENLPVTEKTPTQKAASPYGNTKQMGEEILEHTAAAGHINAISLRYFNPVGAHKSALIGEVQHGVPHHLIPYITETAFGKREFLNIFGSDYPTPDGTCVRDYIHVCDVARAHIKAVEKLLTQNDAQGWYQVYNIGTGEGYSVLNIVDAFTKATGIKIDYKLAPRREGDVAAVYADTKKANEELNWRTECSLTEMMQSAWNWELSVKENPL
ncbi:UDP-glucose 4-epimerase GalE [Mucilaginibacter segetis]|uniref:UDP-glucose 4-epimerase n=1 Tax=Mucilaginibacter segetis TaxID=2793071 RepID=A0A934PNN7_9SPHI|nr:UDP-glucose 4-epimerase GalE [Mucilaginibacter segetis]MBK0377898.1 UDP-glucose 4-epimerase GalE [Mucilaginibacter segetis]